MFKRNVGILDRIVHVGLGIVLLLIGLLLLVVLHANILGLLTAGLGGLGLITGFTGVSVLYLPFGISTLEKEKELMDKCASMATDCQCGQQYGHGQQSSEKNA